MDLPEVRGTIESFPGVCNLHHVHTWQLDEHDVHCEGRVVLDDMLLSEATAVLAQIEDALAERFGLRHVTLQVETGRGHEEAMVPPFRLEMKIGVRDANP